MIKGVMESVSDVFAIWPTAAAMAKDLELPYQTVAKWRQRGRIPQDAWIRLIECAAKRERLLTAADLLRATQNTASA